MPKPKTKTNGNGKSPFKDIAEFEDELKAFSNKFKITIAEHSKRISDYFEISCFNLVVKYYEINGYHVFPDNIQGTQYKYKCTTAGIQSNFSHFKAWKKMGKMREFEIHHNLAVQSSRDPGLFTTPDISVINSNAVKYRKDYYDTKTTFSYVESSDMKTFCEVKNLTPFPELLFSFIGIVNELDSDVMENTVETQHPIQLAPSLMISGKPSSPVSRIKASLESRYPINIIFDLFYSAKDTFTHFNTHNIRGYGPLPEEDLIGLPF
jgi:hypothetical protein